MKNFRLLALASIFGAVVLYTAFGERVREGEKLQTTGSAAKAESMEGMKDCKMMKSGMDCAMMGGTKPVASDTTKKGDKAADTPKGHEGHH